LATAGVGIALAASPAPRRRRGLAEATTRDQIPLSTLKHIEDQLEEAEQRVYRAGAAGALEYIGTGATGIVFCDQAGKAFKAARDSRAARVIEEEAAWLRDAAKIPGFDRHVARGVRYDKKNDVLVRECVIPSKTRDRRVNEKRLRRLHERLGASMLKTYGYGAPEYKPDSYVYTRDRGPVLVDAGFAIRRGKALVKNVLDVLNQRRPLEHKQEARDLAFELRYERGDTVPVDVANRLLRRLQAIDPGVEL